MISILGYPTVILTYKIILVLRQPARTMQSTVAFRVDLDQHSSTSSR